MVARLVRSVAWAACLMLGLGTVSGAAQVESVVLGPATGEADGGDPGGHARDLAEVASMMSPSLSLPQGSTIEPIVVTGEDFRAEPPPVADAVSVPEGFDEGQSIELVDRRTLRSRTFQNPDGSLTSHFGMVPLHFENEAGQLVPVDSRLVVGPDGLLSNAANAWDVRFDRLDRGVEIRVEGASVAAWKTQAPVEPVLEPDGTSVRYVDAWPGVDLVYSVRSAGVDEFIVIKEPTAQSSFDFDMPPGSWKRLNGGFAKTKANWTVSIPGLESFDSAGRAIDAEAQSNLEVVPDGSRLRVSLNPGWLASQPRERFPMVIDPSVVVIPNNLTYTTAYKRDGIVNSDGLFRVGNPGETSTSTNYWRTVSKFDFLMVFGQNVTNATLKTRTVPPTTGILAGSNPFKVYAATEFGYHTTLPTPVLLTSTLTCCDLQQSHTSSGLTAKYNLDALNYYGATALLWTGDERTGYTYKKFDAELELTYNLPPPQPTLAAPADGSYVPTVTPTLAVNPVTDPDPADGEQYSFFVCPSEVLPTDPTCFNSGAPSGAVSWTVPEGKLSWHKSYYWWATVTDGLHTVASAAASSLMPAVPVPANSYGPSFNPLAESLGGFDPSSGNISLFFADVSVPGVAGDLAVNRTYNSLSTSIGAFGKGWTFPFDMSLSEDTTTVGKKGVTVVLSDGRREFHGKNPDGSYANAFGFGSTLTKPAASTAETYVLTDSVKNKFTFSSAGQLTSITDAAGRKTSTARSGQVQTLRDESSGRTLSITWASTGGTREHVTSVATAAVGGAPLVWNYAYSGDLLTKACDARDPNTTTGKCVVFSYNPSGALTKVTRPGGNTLAELTYDAAGRLSSRKNGVGNTNTFAYPGPTNVTNTAGAVVSLIRATVTDPLGRSVHWDHDTSRRLVHRVDQGGFQRWYTFDLAGFLSGLTDEKGATTLYQNDSAGNATQRTDPDGSVWTFTFDTQNRVLTERNPLGHVTTYTNDSLGNRLSQTSPLGRITTWAYTNGTTDPALDGPLAPKGLLKSSTEPGSRVTTYTYDTKGDLRKVVRPNGLTIEYTYDVVGRVVDEKTTYATGVSTTVTKTYNALSQLATTTDPAITNSVSGVTHQRRTSFTYDANANLASMTVSDLLGGDAARTTTYAYDGADRQLSVTDAAGGATTRVFDANGSVTQVTDAAGRVRVTAYNSRNLPTSLTLKAFVDDPVAGSPPRDLLISEWTYDSGGRKATEKDALGRVTRFDYDAVDRVLNVVRLGYVPRTGATLDFVVSSTVYDTAGRVTSRETGHGLSRSTFVYDIDGRVTSETLVNTGSVQRVTTTGYDTAGFVASKTLTGGGRTEQRRWTYFADGSIASETVENGATDLVTSYTRDQRGLATSVTDPLGNVTNHSYDADGRLTMSQGPTISIEAVGGVASASRPTKRTGYNTFGDETHVSDPRSNVTTTEFDGLGREVRITHPTYVDPGGTSRTPFETYVYDPVGNLLTMTNRRLQITDFTFDKLNRSVRQLDPLIVGETTRGATRTVYDDVGNVLSVTDPAGSRVSYSYDGLNRARTSSQTDAGTTFTTTLDYDGLSNMIFRQSPGGAQLTQVWSPAGELLRMTDELGNVSTRSYDVAGHLAVSTDPLGRSDVFTYDQAGRNTRVERKNAAGTVLEVTSYGYDAAGNRTSLTSSSGSTSTFEFNAVGWMTKVIEPITAQTSITTSFGYDAAGNNTRITDGRGSVWTQTFNVWNLLASRVEPSTTAHPALADRTYVTGYDGGGLPILERQPGGVDVSVTYDAMGRKVSETSTGASNSFGYDKAGRLTSVSAPAGPETITYDARGLLRSVTGSAGNSSFSYDADGRMTLRTDVAGATSYTWNGRGDLLTLTDPLTNVTRGYEWDSAGRLKKVTYGSGGSVRAYAWDDTDRVTSDVVTAPGGGTIYSAAYEYWPGGDVKKETVGPSAVAGAGVHSYAYDLAGRLTSWTSPAGSSTGYVWDGAGNRVQTGSVVAVYDARNRLVSNGSEAVTWSARGTLASTKVGAKKTYTFDGLGRMTSADGVSYSYDGLGRVLSRGSSLMQYSGLGWQPSAVSGVVTARSPSGNPVAVSNGGSVGVVGRDRHGDNTVVFSPGGGLLSSFGFDPFGSVTSSTGVAGLGLGFQSSWTDPGSGMVNMGARWYRPGWGGFVSADEVSGVLATPVTLNRYTYANNDPMEFFDPDGRFAMSSVDGWGLGSSFTSGAKNWVKYQGSSTVDWSKIPKVIAGLEAPSAAPKATVTSPASKPTMSAKQIAIFREANVDYSFDAWKARIMAAGVLVGSDVNRLKDLGMDDPRVELFLSLSPGGYFLPGNPVDAIAADLLMAGASASDVERFIGNHCQILDCRLSTRQVLASGVPYLSPFAPSHGESGMALTANTMDGIGLGLGLVQIAHLFGPSRPTVRTPVATEAVDIGGANFAQTTASRTFSSGGSFAGQTIDDVAGALQSGAMSVKDVPIQVIVQDGNTLILNTRSALALEQAGIPRSAWNVVNMTGDAAAQARLAGQLARNGLDSTGIGSVRITGGG